MGNKNDHGAGSPVEFKLKTEPEVRAMRVPDNTDDFPEAIAFARGYSSAAEVPDDDVLVARRRGGIGVWDSSVNGVVLATPGDWKIFRYITIAELGHELSIRNIIIERECELGVACKIGNGCKIGYGCILGGSCELGDGCCIGEFCELGYRCKLGIRCKIEGRCKIDNDCHMGDDCELGHNCTIAPNCKLLNGCKIGCDCSFGGLCTIGKNCNIKNDVRLGRWCKVRNCFTVERAIFISASKHDVSYWGDNCIQIGCRRRTIREWHLRYNKVGKENGYTPCQIREYKKYIDLITDIHKEWARETQEK